MNAVNVGVFSLVSGRCVTLEGMTVLEVIQRSSEFLARKGVDSPRLQAELLLALVLGLPRLKLYLNFERVLTTEEQNRIGELVKRRGAREPLQHIIGSTSFCGLELLVNRHVLIPRPETEILAEIAWQFLDARTLSSMAGENQHGETPRSPVVLDIGTGSGCLAIAVATKCVAARIDATDLSPAALAIAGANAQRHGVAERIRFYEGDLFADLKAENQFDLIISNPPYIPSTEIEKLEPEVRNYDPEAALDGGEDGMKFYRRLASEAPPFLAPQGSFMAEFGDGQEKSLATIFTEQGWVVEQIIPDLSRKPRILVARHRR
jgi:release factor glutamine methyltransferase